MLFNAFSVNTCFTRIQYMLTIMSSYISQNVGLFSSLQCISVLSCYYSLHVAKSRRIGKKLKNEKMKIY